MAAWLAVLLAACGSCGGLDASRGGEGSARRAPGAILPGDASLRSASAAGVVESIDEQALPGGTPAWRVTIAGDAPIAERSFRVVVPPEVALPFAVGDAIGWRFETMPGPPTYQPTNATITSGSGELLALYGVTPPEGWTVERAGEARRTDRGDWEEVEHRLSFTHGGETVEVDGTAWRRLAASGGAFYVHGSASSLEGEIPADGGPTMAFMIVRAR